MAITDATTGINNLEKLKQDKNPALAQLKADSSNMSGADTAKKSLAGDFDSFLLMLTTQLKNQDPTQPMDTNQFTQQLVAFSGVEQAIATNKNLETLIASSKTSEINNAVGYIGKTIEAKGDKGVLQNKFAAFTYSLPAGASKATITITDSAGRAVFSGAGSTKEGKNTVFWNGTNSFNQAQEKDGIYTITVQAKNAAGDNLEATTYTSGIVDSVDMSQDELTLWMGDFQVKLADVLGIRDTYVPTVPSNSSSNGSSNSSSSSSSSDSSSSNSNSSNSNASDSSNSNSSNEANG